ncbi:MAG: phosphoribosylamine--glycine ligase, partial [Candidatus Methylumidiphilus sp.]
TSAIHARVLAEVIEPTLAGMAADGIPYTGFLYAGLLISPKGAIKVLEFNCRFGDPETQPILLRLRSDLVALCLAALDGRLDQAEAAWDPRPALGVVLAADGYPGDYRKGDVISGLPADSSNDAKVFVAGARVHDGQVVTSGGRVLCACALGDTVAEAQQKAYALAGQIHWDGLYYRKDIGHRAVGRA